MATYNILYSGFGGQGILFSGKYLAYEGLIAGKKVSWLPSYGPEMRGGTANCSVIISDEEIGSPIVENPDLLVVMNLPSLDKYEDKVVPGGLIIVDSSLINRKVKRDDVKVIYLPATEIANKNNFPTLANMIIAGRVLKEMEMDLSNIDTVLSKIVSARHQDLIEANKTAINIGFESN